MASQVVAHTQEFGPYELRFSRPEDFESINRAIEANALEESLTSSKKDAVYPRGLDLVKWGVEKGAYTVLDRVLPNDAPEDHPRHLLVGETGIYSLGIGANGFQDRFPIERPHGTQPMVYYVLDVGSTRYLKEIDAPNEQGVRPSNCFYVPLVAMTILNAFRLAGKKFGERSHFIPDVITANVQTRKDMIPIKQRLMSPPLSFKLLYPSDELERQTGGTTTGGTFTTMDKEYFVFPLNRLPETAAWFLQSYETGTISGTNGVVRNIIHVNYNVDPEFMETVEAIDRNKEWFAGLDEGASLTEVRRQLSRVMRPVENLPPVAANGNTNGNGTNGYPRRPLSASPANPNNLGSRQIESSVSPRVA